MTFIINKINTKKELDTLVNIEHLFEQSESYINEHAQLPSHIISREEKFSYVKNIFADCCAREKWFIYHVKQSDKDLLLMLARVVDDTTWQYEFSLLSPDQAGSRSWIYEKEFTDKMNAFRDSYGITNIAVRDWKTGTSKNYFKKQFKMNLQTDKKSEDSLTQTHSKRIK